MSRGSFVIGRLHQSLANAIDCVQGVVRRSVDLKMALFRITSTKLVEVQVIRLIRVFPAIGNYRAKFSIESVRRLSF